MKNCLSGLVSALFLSLDVGRAGERRRLQLQDGAVPEPGRRANCRATSKVSRVRGLRRMGAGRPLFGLVEPAILFQRILRLLIGFEIAQRGPRVRQTRAATLPIAITPPRRPDRADR